MEAEAELTADEHTFHLRERLVARRGEAVVLQVMKVNPSKRLYERLGFVVSSELPHHYLMHAYPPQG